MYGFRMELCNFEYVQHTKLDKVSSTYCAYNFIHDVLQSLFGQENDFPRHVILMRTNKVTSFVILFPIFVSFPMLMFYDTICGICMPNSETDFQYQIFHLLKIILFLVVYFIPVLCSSRSFWIIRNSRKCSIKKKRQFHNCQSGGVHKFSFFDQGSLDKALVRIESVCGSLNKIMCTDII